MSRLLTVLAFVVAQIVAPGAFAQEAVPDEPEGPKVNWIPGPKTVELGKQVAEVALDSGYLFAGPDDTKKLLEAMGNHVDGSEVGLVVPDDENQSWMLIFEWNPVGFVKDEEKDKIDADALLASIREGTEEGNKRRAQRGMPALHVTGWQEPPHYDEASHNLTWSILAKSEAGPEIVNYNVRLLGREGFMSVTLVDAPSQLAASKPSFEKVLGGFSYKTGKTYAEWVKGDRVAEYGLTALVAAGAGAAAVKLGFFAMLGKFLAKGWKLVVGLLAAVGAGVSKMFGSGRRGKMSGTGNPPDSGTQV